MKLILASNSPRRKELLTEFGFDFIVVGSDYQETPFNASAKQTVKRFALGKAKSVFDGLQKEDKVNAVVLGADTVVCYNDKILGKPEGEEQARQMLLELSGKTHSVFTGYAIITQAKTIVKVVESKVTFNCLTEEIIKEYIASGKPLDKAGAYGIQDGFDLVKKCKGSFNNVVGLPIEKFSNKLKKLLK